MSTTVVVRIADSESECPGAESIPSWKSHRVPAGEELFGTREQCFGCATVDGVPTPGYPELTAGVET